MREWDVNSFDNWSHFLWERERESQLSWAIGFGSCRCEGMEIQSFWQSPSALVDMTEGVSLPLNSCRHEKEETHVLTIAISLCRKERVEIQLF